MEGLGVGGVWGDGVLGGDVGGDAPGIDGVTAEVLDDGAAGEDWGGESEEGDDSGNMHIGWLEWIED